MWHPKHPARDAVAILGLSMFFSPGCLLENIFEKTLLMKFNFLKLPI
jgi:hypothetical protein